MLYKFQDRLDFLNNVASEIGEIFRLKDGSHYFENVYDLWTIKVKEKVGHLTNDFEENVTKVMVPHIRINLTRIKVKALEYFCKVLQIVKINFEEHLKEVCGDLPPPIDCFSILHLLWNNTQSPQLRQSCETLVFELANDTLYGFNTFRSEKLLCEIIRPKLDHSDTKIGILRPTVQTEEEESFDDPLGVKDKKSESNESNSKSKSVSVSSEDSDIDVNIQDAQLTDKIAVIQEWLFVNQLPTFSKNEEIMDLLKKDEDLALFFKFIISPFKSMIHHIVILLTN